MLELGDNKVGREGKKMYIRYSDNNQEPINKRWRPPEQSNPISIPSASDLACVVVLQKLKPFIMELNTLIGPE